MSKETIEELDRKIETLSNRMNVLAKSQELLDSCEAAVRRIGENANFAIYSGGNETPKLSFLPPGLSKAGSVLIEMDASEKAEIEKLVSAMLNREQERARRGLEFFSKSQLIA